jgi:hypothetical protein
MFVINFQYYYMLCFRGGASCKKKNLLDVSLYILSTRVDEIRGFNKRSFSLALNNH